MRPTKLITIVILMLSVSFAAFADKKPTATVYGEDKLAIMVTKENPQFVIRLKANPTTGYNWFLREYDAKLIMPIKHQYEAPNTQMVGAPGYDVWTFAVKSDAFTVPQITQLRLIYTRAWDMNDQATLLVYRVAIQ